MLYVTGDLHGDETRLRRFSRGLRRRRDVLLVCGDFGFVWDGSEREKRVLSRLEKLDCTIFFVEGTHDNLDLLAACPRETVCGGPAGRVAKNIFWLQRGCLYQIEGRSVFALGGAQSTDADERVEGVSWWRNELPTSEELAFAEETFRRAGRADIIITHQSPCAALGRIEYSPDSTHPQKVFLARLAKSADYGHWYFGGDHLDRPVSPRMTAVFEKILPVPEKFFAAQEKDSFRHTKKAGTAAGE